MISNSAGSQGGAIYHWGLSQAGQTSLIYPLVIVDSLVAGNQAGDEGGGLYFREGFAGSNTPIQLMDAVFENNTAAVDGGGAYLGQPGSVLGGSFVGNHSLGGSGAGLFALDTLQMDRCLLHGNQAAVEGGGAAIVAQAGSHHRIQNCVLSSNQAVDRGAAIVLGPGGLQLELVHATIAGTTLNPTSAIYVENSQLVLTNTIVVSHTNAIFHNSPAGSTGTVHAQNTLLYGNMGDVAGAVTNSGAIYGDPGFVAPALDDYHLTFGSAAIDAGVDSGLTTDLDSDPRPVIDFYDIGADEYGGSTLVMPDVATTITATTGAGQRALIIRIPRGALSAATIIRLLPLGAPTVMPQLPQRVVSPGFQLLTAPAGSLVAAIAQVEAEFLQPVEIVMTYLDSDIRGLCGWNADAGASG